MISSQTWLPFPPVARLWKKASLLGGVGCGLTYSWGNLASAGVGIASDAAGHFEADVEEAILKGTGGGIRTGRVGWDLPELFCKSPPPSYTSLCLEAFPGNQIHFSFDLAFKCSESGNVSCPMKAHLLNILRTQTEHFHGRSERILSVTPGTDVKFVLR